MATRIGTAGRDFLLGTPQPDFLNGLAESDELNGRGGADFLDGGVGGDAPLNFGGILPGQGGTLAGFGGLFGKAGNDVLFGNDGDDLLNGGRGRDKLQGGLDNDVFQFNANEEGKANRDVIQDFNFGGAQDFIDLRAFNINFNALNFIDRGDDTLITIDGTDFSLIVKDEEPNQFTQIDFIL